MEQSRDFWLGLQVWSSVHYRERDQVLREANMLQSSFNPTTHVKMDIANFFLYSVIEKGAYDGSEWLHR